MKIHTRFMAGSLAAATALACGGAPDSRQRAPSQAPATTIRAPSPAPPPATIGIRSLPDGTKLGVLDEKASENSVSFHYLSHASVEDCSLAREIEKLAAGLLSEPRVAKVDHLVIDATQAFSGQSQVVMFFRPEGTAWEADIPDAVLQRCFAARR